MNKLTGTFEINIPDGYENATIILYPRIVINAPDTGNDFLEIDGSGGNVLTLENGTPLELE